MDLTEGPYYTPGSPENASLYEEGMAGTKLILTGYVFDTNCQPVENAWLDFWQADSNGNYDNNGYTLRGHQYTDSNGRFELITVVPGIYPGRTEHIHFKVQAPNGQVITSQLFFPGVAQNDSDGIFDESLLLPIQETSDGLLGQFNFIVPAQ
jgi:protocatechuate 3,4-dioxygenase beta subunit